MTGPPIDALVRHLAEAPPEVRDGTAHVDAVVADTLMRLGGELPRRNEVKSFASLDARTAQLVLVACWLLHHGQVTGDARKARDWLKSLGKLAGLVEPGRFLDDPDRREELARLGLDALGVLPEGESKTEAADRLQALSSVVRDEVIRAAREREKHVAEVRRKLKEQQEYSARWGRE